MLRSVVIAFPLIPDRQHGHRAGILHLEQQHIAAGAEADDEFAQEGSLAVAWVNGPLQVHLQQ